MDKMNKIAMADESLHYRYKQDSNIPIGVLGMIDDTLAISECGSDSIRKNAVINSFMESERLTLSEEKSVVLHYGSERKCVVPCPTLRVHNEPMLKKTDAKYLGNMLSTEDGLNATIEDRRSKGWGKIASIMGILSEVDMGVHKLEAGLKLREAILINSVLYSAEAWSGVTQKHLARLEVVDTALLRKLTGGHSKCPTEFHHLETRTWKLRHHLTYLRLMYHHQILSRDDNETIKKIYQKQKSMYCKGDWYQLIKEDFEFINCDINEEEIASTPKSIYKTKIKNLVNKAAFNYFLNIKETHSKLDETLYTQFELQPYLTTSLLTQSEKELLYLLRSKCHSSKNNFRKLHKNNTQCQFQCGTAEDQRHTFFKCKHLVNKINNSLLVHYEHIFGTLDEQIEVMKIFAKI